MLRLHAARSTSDLVAQRQRAARREVAICRLEQLYPVPMRDLRAMLDGYPNADEIVWVQEEPENMGAWDFIRPHLEEVAERPARSRRSRGRAARARRKDRRPATRVNQQALVEAGVRAHVAEAAADAAEAGAEPSLPTTGRRLDHASHEDSGGVRHRVKG